jgi:hypothetical protein
LSDESRVNVAIVVHTPCSVARRANSRRFLAGPVIEYASMMASSLNGVIDGGRVESLAAMLPEHTVSRRFRLRS